MRRAPSTDTIAQKAKEFIEGAAVQTKEQPELLEKQTPAPEEEEVPLAYRYPVEPKGALYKQQQSAEPTTTFNIRMPISLKNRVAYLMEHHVPRRVSMTAVILTGFERELARLEKLAGITATTYLEDTDA